MKLPVNTIFQSSWIQLVLPKTPILFNNVKKAYKDWTIEQITYESYRYADALAMSAKKECYGGQWVVF